MNDHLLHRHARRPRRYLAPAIVLALVAGALLCSNAWARGPYHHGFGHGHGGVRFGLAIGAPLLWYGAGPRWYGDPYYPYYSPYYGYYPPRVIAPEPPIYVEQASPSLWYFCNNPQGYYPYVKHCTTAWRSVAPQPPVDR